MAVLVQTTKVHPGVVVMTILPDENLVFQQTATGVNGFAPVLTCTLNAIKDLVESAGGPRKPMLVTSDNGLIPYVLNKAENEISPIISYRRKSMSLADYVTLGTQGIFYNETFRFRLERGRLVGR